MFVPSRGLLFILAAGFTLAVAPALEAQTPILSLKASNYNATTGVWTDSSSSADNATIAAVTGAIASPSTPALQTGATPNGSPAVVFNGAQYLNLTTAITAGNSTGYTVFTFLQPVTNTGEQGTILAGTAGSFHYRVNAGHQDLLEQGTVDLGHGTATLPNAASGTLASTSFSLIDTAVSPAGGAFRFGDAATSYAMSADGTTAGGTFTDAIRRIRAHTNPGGNPTAAGEFFTGDIAAIQIYSGVLTAPQIAAVEATFITTYVVPEPGTWTMLLGGCGALCAVQRLRSRKA